MEYTTTVGTHLNEEEEDRVEVLGEATINFNVNSVVEWGM